MSEHIATQLRCPTLFTTHYTELTELAEEQDNGNMSTFSILLP